MEPVIASLHFDDSSLRFLNGRPKQKGEAADSFLSWLIAVGFAPIEPPIFNLVSTLYPPAVIVRD